ncbi:MAG: hypothetical protein K0S08_2027 [Gammaproteobacteria bacterium]|jgi:hypothetical protein|nr:hypothetical protein [Gammaproteobacteria bacterium]
MTEDNNVIDLFKKVFQPGMYAWHERYGYCRIIAVDGEDYTIRVIRRGPGGAFFKTYEVDVSELDKVEYPLLDDVTLLPVQIPMEDE